MIIWMKQSARIQIKRKEIAVIQIVFRVNIT
jgi:hypothetical protein